MSLKNEEFKPAAYKTGRAQFLGFALTVDERVFVPNPETELLVQLVSNEMLQLTGEGKRLVVDVGTGSGNIAIALGIAHPDWQVTATDISSEALEVASINVQQFDLHNVELICTDLVEGLTIQPELIVCNLPWGAAEFMLKSNTTEAMAFMPSVAIYPKDGVIGSYLRLADQVREKKWKTIIFAEVGRIPENVVKQEMPTTYQWEYVKVAPDYNVLKIGF